MLLFGAPFPAGWASDKFEKGHANNELGLLKSAHHQTFPLFKLQFDNQYVNTPSSNYQKLTKSDLYGSDKPQKLNHFSNGKAMDSLHQWRTIQRFPHVYGTMVQESSIPSVSVRSVGATAHGPGEGWYMAAFPWRHSCSNFWSAAKGGNRFVSLYGCTTNMGFQRFILH